MDVTVGAETFSVTADAESFLHWTDVRFLTGADLKKLNSLTRENG